MIKNTVTKNARTNLVTELKVELVAWDLILYETMACIQQYTIPKANIMMAPTICTARELTT